MCDQWHSWRASKYLRTEDSNPYCPDCGLRLEQREEWTGKRHIKRKLRTSRHLLQAPDRLYGTIVVIAVLRQASGTWASLDIQTCVRTFELYIHIYQFFAVEQSASEAQAK